MFGAWEATIIRTSGWSFTSVCFAALCQQCAVKPERATARRAARRPASGCSGSPAPPEGRRLRAPAAAAPPHRSTPHETPVNTRLSVNILFSLHLIYLFVLKGWFTLTTHKNIFSHGWNFGFICSGFETTNDYISIRWRGRESTEKQHTENSKKTCRSNSRSEGFNCNSPVYSKCNLKKMCWYIWFMNRRRKNIILSVMLLE